MKKRAAPTLWKPLASSTAFTAALTAAVPRAGGAEILGEHDAVVDVDLVVVDREGEAAAAGWRSRRG